VKPAAQLATEDRPTPQIAAAGTTAAESRRGSAAAGLAALAAGHLAVDCCTGIWPVYKTLAHLDLHVAGAIATAAGMIGNGLQIGFGFLGDRGFARKLLIGGALLASAVTFVPYTSDYRLLFALVLATSIGSAAFHPIGAGAAGALSRHRTGVLLALFLAGGYVGYSLSQVAFTAVYRAAPRATAVLAALPALAALGLWRFLPSAPNRGQTFAAWTQSLRGAWRPLSSLFAVQALAATVNVSLIFLLPDLLLERRAPAWVAQGGGHFALVLGGALALLPAGHASDRLGGRRLLIATNSLTGLSLAAVLALDLPTSLLLPTLTAFGAFNSANNLVAVSEGNRLLPGQNSGVSALLMGLPWGVAALGPVVAGTLAARPGGSVTAALGSMAVCVPLALVAAALLPARGGGGVPNASGAR
jgi:FSR family fosmidomycin resistance protein-like MFS transporter